MAAARLVRRRLLDPREAGQAAGEPIADAVNIPFSELPERVYELPPRDQELGVVGPASLARDVVTWLGSIGRRAVAVETDTQRGKVSGVYLGRLWEPNPFLCEVLRQLTPGAAVDLACGTGRDAIHMSSCGWDVTAVDVLPDALSRGRELAERYAGALRPIDWVTADLEVGSPRFERTFDLITAFRYLHRPLFRLLREWVRPGGSVVWETFTTVHRERYGKPSRDGHVLAPGELSEVFSGFDLRHYSEGWRGWAHTARVWAVLSGAE
jgi:SAM-dependent methyltransferase